MMSNKRSFFEGLHKDICSLLLSEYMENLENSILHKISCAIFLEDCTLKSAINRATKKLFLRVPTDISVTTKLINEGCSIFLPHFGENGTFQLSNKIWCAQMY